MAASSWERIAAPLGLAQVGTWAGITAMPQLGGAAVDR